MVYGACVEEAGPLEKVRPDEIKVGIREKLEYCHKCRGELSDFFTSVISDKRQGSSGRGVKAAARGMYSLNQSRHS